MKVPLLDLSAQHEPLRQDIMAAVARVLESNVFILGEEVDRFEEAIARYCGCAHAIGVSSGTDALVVALMALDIGAGDQVITTPYSFFATAGAIVRLGAEPVFVDIDPATYNIDPKLIESAITPRTRAIVPVHLFGQCAEMDPILAVAERHGLAVIEDAAQAIGSQYRDERRAASMGTLGCLSFFPSKNLGALGDAGMVLTNDPNLAEKVRILRAHGSKPKYYHKMVGGNFRIDSLQAAVLSVKLPHLDRWTAMRQANAARYVHLLNVTGIAERHRFLPPAAAYAHRGLPNFHIYNQFVLRVPDRDRVREFLGRRGIGTEIYYPVPLHLQQCFSSLGYAPGSLPAAEKAAMETLALPVYPELKEEHQHYIVECLDAYEVD